MEGRLETIDLKNIRVTDKLFGTYQQLVSDKMIPYQWEILNDRIEDAVPSYCINNFRIAVGDVDGIREGKVFQDTDLYKWIEAVAYCIEDGSGVAYEELVDEVVELIGRAQAEDGYLNTYYTVVAPDKRFSNLVEGHELYSAGHLIEAAVAYYTATGKRKLLSIAEKFADLICQVFGPHDDQLRGYPGHQGIELALVKLYRISKEQRYLDCASFFISERGAQPNYLLEEIAKRGGYEFFCEFEEYDLQYAQAHLPPVEQDEAQGHAVRAMYMYSAMADLALELDDVKMKEACDKLWESVTKRKMYITGSIGSSGLLERFTADYDLPNNTNYSETCASIGLMMFGQRMNTLTKDAKYYEVVERALYNTVLSGINITGDRYFYVNPLEVVPAFCTDHSYMKHVKANRQKWFSCACCPPNVARTLGSLGQYIYAKDREGIYINQFISSTVEVLVGETKILLELTSALIETGQIKVRFDSPTAIDLPIKIRIPEYVGEVKAQINGLSIRLEKSRGYACFYGLQEGETLIALDFEIKPRWVAAHPQVRGNEGKVALMKGPYVYCLEEIDNGDNLAAIYVKPNELPCDGEALKLVSDLVTLNYEGVRICNEGLDKTLLYRELVYDEKPIALKAIPYFLWNNRGEGEMLVWQKIRFS